MAQVLYLGVEGVLFAARSASIRLQPGLHQTPRANPLPLLPIISRLIACKPEISVVINSWMVVDFGYQAIVNLLPIEIARMTIGATMPGNRAHRRCIMTSRADVLRADIRRRCPNYLVIVDASSHAIPYEYLAQSVHVKTTSPRGTAAVADQIVHLLDAGADTTDDLGLFA